MSARETDAATCYACDDPRPRDGTGAVLDGRWRPLCPACEDAAHAARDARPGLPPDAPPRDRVPAHGGTTR